MGILIKEYLVNVINLHVSQVPLLSSHQPPTNDVKFNPWKAPNLHDPRLREIGHSIIYRYMRARVFSKTCSSIHG
jgi:hypothetical protein